MAEQLTAFLDTSVLFASMWSEVGGSRAILQLGAAGAVRLLVSLGVLRELDEALGVRAPHLVADSAMYLDRSRVETVPEAGPDAVARLAALVGYVPDARVIAAAESATADYFVTLDRKHFLDSATVRAAVTLPMGTPSDFLRWFRERIAP